MSEAESAEVLEKPARGILEFDPAALAEAYRLTRGQPLLSALAWATDEINRPQLDLPGIEARAAEVRLSIAVGLAFQIVERLADEEILLRLGPTHRFAVPLYRLALAGGFGAGRARRGWRQSAISARMRRGSGF